MREDVCRVCGWDHGEPAWADGEPLYLICDCCGAESGVDDVDPATVLAYRDLWVAADGPWFSAQLRPAGWSAVQQVEANAPQVVSSERSVQRAGRRIARSAWWTRGGVS